MGRRQGGTVPQFYPVACQPAPAAMLNSHSWHGTRPTSPEAADEGEQLPQTGSLPRTPSTATHPPPTAAQARALWALRIQRVRADTFAVPAPLIRIRQPSC